MTTKQIKKEKIPDLDFNRFKVILIGVSNYPEDKKVKNVPNINVNIETLRNVFTNKSLIGVPEKNVYTSLNSTKVQIEKELTSFVKQTEENETLIVYYTGHGFISSDTFELFLATSDTELDFIDSTGISIKRFRQIISQSFAKRKVIILDACHSGGVHNTLSNNKSIITASLNNFEGEYVISSSSEDEPSLFPIGKRNLPTFFTGELIDILSNGINNGNQVITMSDVFNNIYRRFKAKNLPLPQQSNNNNAAFIPVAYNQKVEGNIDNNNTIPENYLNIASKSDSNVKIITRKSSVKNIIASVAIILAFGSLFILRTNNNDGIVIKPINTSNEYSLNRSVISFNNNSFVETINNADNELTQLIQKAKVFMQADGGNELALETLYEAKSISPDNIEVNQLIDSLESAQN